MWSEGVCSLLLVRRGGRVRVPPVGEIAVLNQQTTQEKYEALQALLESLGSVVVAYSGGVDSTFLLKVAVDTLGDNARGLTAISESYPAWERREAKALGEAMGAEVIEVETREIERAEYRANDGNRCYHCKVELFDAARAAADQLAVRHLCYGAIPDDLGDHRPGMTAATERRVLAPLVEVGLTKVEIRALSRSLGLPTWDKPATACLSSRFPFGTEIDEEKLKLIGRCEERLRLLGFVDFRARYHEHLVRLEFAPSELERVFGEPALRRSIIQEMKDVGFKFVTIDLEGYRQGSANVLVTIGG